MRRCQRHAAKPFLLPSLEHAVAACQDSHYFAECARCRPSIMAMASIRLSPVIIEAAVPASAFIVNNMTVRMLDGARYS